jgi:predicted CopG family antitoxin
VTRLVEISTCTSKGRRIGTKSLTITEEAYDRLREHKREGESFTETILRLTGAEHDPLEGFGAMRDVEGFREAVDSTRDELDTDLRNRRAR